MPSARSWVVHSHPVVVEQQPGSGGGTRARVLDLHSGAFLTDDRYLFMVAAGDTRFPDRAVTAASGVLAPLATVTVTMTPSFGPPSTSLVVRVGELPLELELDLFFVVLALVFDAECGGLRQADALAGDLDAERPVGLESIRQPAALRDELDRVFAFDVMRGHGSFLPARGSDVSPRHGARFLGHT